jgi:EAL domain-containing protein (putative c-di-GMP-specific phosphodiesterase class I)
MTAYLEQYLERGGPAERLEISRSPFRIGRSRGADLTIYSHKVSKDHAHIFQTPHGYLLKDLSSTNGTFVNGKRIDEVPLADGDIIHVAHWELGFGLDVQDTTTSPTRSAVSMTKPTHLGQQDSLIRLGTFLSQLVSSESVSILFQPIVDLRSGARIGYEALGRGRHFHLHQSPIKLFQLAEKCQMERDLCRLFRTHAIKIGNALPAGLRLFINIHPSEFAREDFFDSLDELMKRNLAHRQLVLEISEQSITNVAELRLIGHKLRERGIEFAYDDFGSGQARLLEVAECPPHFLKLDRSLIQSMEVSESSRQLVRAFLSAISETEVKVIAEGIETERAAELCLASGCHLGQGFLFSRPVFLGDILSSNPAFHPLGPE